MFQPSNPHSHPPPLPRPNKLRDIALKIGKSTPTPCTSSDCQQCPPSGSLAQASSGMRQSGYQISDTARSRHQAVAAAYGIVDCMLCDTSGHAHGTVRLIFEIQGPSRYRQGQILRVLLPGGSGPQILVTSQPNRAGVMHGQLLLAQGEPLPAQFGPDAAFGLMFQVCARQQSRSN
ncbi:hypothetical protein HS961_12235 [Comamonas piscis]|uniref:Uncharacterized protein n=1 Tax=Comamonas piscis TaxID=1562974 RepID=A0A7G5EHQ7_9BURK|nr:hypothetical protein [Comamonas piscis]QMV73532.1 hypothetical protein HS961_12235 [Comamonas piscis]WSO31949.1 hypothetical protein VUJ63_12270 [Comamonas piscis]